jgi:hypothetical protein
MMATFRPGLDLRLPANTEPNQSVQFNGMSMLLGRQTSPVAIQSRSPGGSTSMSRALASPSPASAELMRRRRHTAHRAALVNCIAQRPRRAFTQRGSVGVGTTRPSRHYSITARRRRGARRRQATTPTAPAFQHPGAPAQTLPGPDPAWPRPLHSLAWPAGNFRGTAPLQLGQTAAGSPAVDGVPRWARSAGGPPRRPDDEPLGTPRRVTRRAPVGMTDRGSAKWVS